MKKKLILMVGIPGVGKSTETQKYLSTHQKNTKIVSRDAIRFSLVKEDEEYFSKEKEVFKTFVSNIKNELANGYDVIADATHISIGSRTKLLRALGNSLKEVEVIAMVVRRPLDVALSQNKGREARSRVPEAAIRRMNSQFEMPTEEEGFDHIICIY